MCCPSSLLSFSVLSLFSFSLSLFSVCPSIHPSLSCCLCVSVYLCICASVCVCVCLYLSQGSC
ncbi:hypothetical protein F5H01DRAFT_334206 [Linnemannia elongata]|nr:hypothetical protein F5H01DRAFT_334206 [Linnemannia elongata]